jgi:two-component system sensor histidine kinase SenX3
VHPVELIVSAAALLVLGASARWIWIRERHAGHLQAENLRLASARDALSLSLTEMTRRWDEVLTGVAEGIVIVGQAGTPTYANEAARNLLGLGMGGLPPRLPSEEIASLVRRVASGERVVDEIVKLRVPESLTVEVRASPLALDGEVLVTLRDISEEARTQTMRRQFVSHASHELKSPVAGIHALAEAILEAAEHDPGRLQSFSQRLTEETTRLGRLVTDLLDLSRLEEPAVISNRRVDLSEVVTRELTDAAETARTKGVNIGGNIEPGVTITGDEQQLGVLVRNLLENAVRHTTSGGNVNVGVARADRDVRVEVQDDGAGIPLKAQARVFERFYRVDEGRARSQGGTGLGLAIVKHVAELHGGVVELRSELGEGSTFTVTLPGEIPSTDRDS